MSNQAGRSHCHQAAIIIDNNTYSNTRGGYVCADCGGDPRSPKEVKRDNDRHEEQLRSQTRAGWIVGAIILIIIAVFALAHYHDPQPDAAPSLCEQAQTC